MVRRPGNTVNRTTPEVETKQKLQLPWKNTREEQTTKDKPEQ